MTTWTRERPDLSIERRIIIGMIISDRVLRNLSMAYKPRFLTVQYMATVAGWCVQYLQKYDRAPGRHITDLYEAHRRNNLEPEISGLIGKFLESINDEYEEHGLNEDYLLDQAGQYFRERALTLLKEDLEERLGQGNLLAAQEAVAKYSSPESLETLGCEPMRDMLAIRDALAGDDELFTLPGALGKLLGPFVREDAWGLVGSYKGGKSWLCYYIQDMALYARLNVARFSFEMNRRKENRRFIQGISGAPVKPPRSPDGRIWWPVWDCQYNQDGSCQRVERTGRATLLRGEQRPPFGQAPQGYLPCSACRGRRDWQIETWAEPIEKDPLAWRAAWKHAQAVSRQLRGARFKFQYWAMRSAGVAEIKSTLEVWEHLEGFIPDLIVVDSPDIMKAPRGGDPRHVIIENRQMTVALAQQYHAMLLMPFQAGSKEAIERKSKRDSDVGESVQILGDVDGMIVMDQSKAEADMGRLRIRTSVQRDDRRGQQVMALQCLDLGQAVVDSEFMGD